MRYSGLQIVFQEVPEEISLAIHIVGCPLRCAGCHSSDLWSSSVGKELTLQTFKDLVQQYKKFISCVLFMGGEWEAEALLTLIKVAQQQQLKVALYSGLDLKELNNEIRTQLDYLKYGPYIKNLGGLDSKITNQKILNMKTKEVLNSYFTEENTYDQVEHRAN